VGRKRCPCCPDACDSTPKGIFQVLQPAIFPLLGTLKPGKEGKSGKAYVVMHRKERKERWITSQEGTLKVKGKPGCGVDPPQSPAAGMALARYGHPPLNLEPPEMEAECRWGSSLIRVNFRLVG
jgi:hypothetical protein